MTDFPSVLDLANLAADGSEGFRILGAATGGLIGRSVRSAGDVNGDGIDDMIVGGPRVDLSFADAGAAYVVFGRDAASDGHALDLSVADLDGTNGFRIDGRWPQGYAGYSVSSAGDINGDGIDDLIFGVPGFDSPTSGGGTDAGEVFVLFGRNTAVDGAFSSVVVRSAINGATGFRISGASAGSELGKGVSSIGDINNDGIDDIAVGAHLGGATAGTVFVLFGKDTDQAGNFAADVDLSALAVSDGFQIQGVGGDGMGAAIASAGDVNGDGIGDMIISAHNADSRTGAAYIVFGRDTDLSGDFSNLGVHELNGLNGFEVRGMAVSDRAGKSVAGAGDINGDGIDDLAIGAIGVDTYGYETGATFVVFGKNTALTGGFAASIDLGALDGTDGFRVTGEGGGDYSGSGVALVDVNADGFEDLVIGAYRYDSSRGAAYVVFGKDTGLDGAFAANLHLADLDGGNGFKVIGGSAGEQLGFSLASAGDVNGDGLEDLIMSARTNDLGGTNTGAVYVVYGRVTPLNFVGTAADDTRSGRTTADSLSGMGGRDLLYGMAGDDLIDGGAGPDMLDGGLGADQMTGGSGDDTFFVDDIGDVTVEGAGEGIDRVRASITLILGDNLEHLTLDGTADLGGTGNGLANSLDGNSGANVLSGAGGNDLIKGHMGDDTLNGDAGNDQLLGGDGADILDGGADNDRLEGGAGSDSLAGGTGNDILEGGAHGDTLSGDAGADQLLGGDGADTLNGGSENDSLNGGAGADSMTGGTGDDTYFVDNAGDSTVEASGQGIDQVRAAISHTLGDDIEVLILEGSGNLSGTGNSVANILNGNTGDNVLDGAGGNDLLKGGLGADTLIGGTGADILVGGGGADVFVVGHDSVYSSLTPGGRNLEVDTVSDYASDDRIDLSAIDAIAGGADSAFTQVSAFDGQAGRLVLSFAAGSTTLSLDVDGDRKADYMMKINGDIRGEVGDWLL